MTCCNHCQDAAGFFNPRTAQRDLRRYRKSGPAKSTRLLLEGLHNQRADDQTLLDIGGGVGAIQHDLLKAGVSRAVQVDASPAYLEASEQEASRLGHRERVRYFQGDFVELAAELAPADIVTLDRVICCYPDMQRLVSASVGKAQRLYGLVFPRERWIVTAGVATGNVYFRLRGSAFRAYLHTAERVDAVIQRHGFRCTYSARTFLWHIVIYARTPR